MELPELAYPVIFWRGYDYCLENRVLSCEKKDDRTVIGKVNGKGGVYDVLIDLDEPLSSKCTCPFAEGSKLICKHMVALYLTAFPEEAEIYSDALLNGGDSEDRAERRRVMLEDHISQMTKTELQNALLKLLLTGPERQLEEFFTENVEEDY